MASIPEFPQLPPLVEAELHEAADLSEWIGDHHPPEVLASRNHLLAAPYFAICMDHREAILLLFAFDSRSAAFALWRSVYEALVRGLWAEQCATDKDFNFMGKTRELPSFDTMIKRLDTLEPGAGASSYSMVKKKVWKRMSHFAHGGVDQLARWAGPHGVGARHPDDEVVQLIRQLNVYGLLACMAVARLAGLPTDDHETKISEYLEGM